jgi:hypothetical protein
MKIAIKLSLSQAQQLEILISNGLAEMPERGSDRIKSMVMSLMGELQIKIARSLVVPQKQYRMTLSFACAQALVVAIEYGYIFALPEDIYAQNVLTSTHNYLHQKTA